jgi:D-cysteine desulfhydrase family pyridoxal phosphate-dependent enzyme
MSEPIARIRFAHLPTPVEKMPRLTAALGGPELAVKRDDLTGLAFGGNKTRKLEFLVAEARDQGADTLITAGALQSNHCRQTAAAAARFGFGCLLVLVGAAPQQPSGNLLLDALFDAEIVWVEKNRREAALQEAFDRLKAQGKKPYLVPYGGSNPTGALGYVYAMEELMAQGKPPDWIVVASSSGGTQAGLALGARLFHYPGQVLGISVDEGQGVLQERVASLCSQMAPRVGVSPAFTAGEILVNAEYSTPGYGVLTSAEREAIRLFAHREGLLLDPVYTGRAAAGMIDLIRRGFVPKDDTVLFWHTGGQTALFAEQYQKDLLH